MPGHGAIDDALVRIAPSIRDNLYGISEDTMGRGAAELEYFKLTKRRSKPITVAGAPGRARRHEHKLTLETGFDRSPLDQL